MAVKFEKIVAEDLSLGIGDVEVTMPGGGSAIGSRIHGCTIPSLAFIGTMDGGQSITQNVDTVVQVDEEVLDTVDAFNPATFKFIPVVEGLYFVGGFIVMQSLSGVVTLSIFVNAVEVTATQADKVAAVAKTTVTALVPLEVGDEVTLVVSHTHASSRTITSARFAAFSVGSV